MISLTNEDINLYINKMIFIYDIYKSNKKNYYKCLDIINNLFDNNKDIEDNHINLLDIISIDNYKDNIKNNIINKNLIKTPLDTIFYSNNLIKIYKENNKNITFKNLNNILKNSIIIKLNEFSNLIKINESDEIDINKIKIIVDNEHYNSSCLICLEEINKFNIFECCLSKICLNCLKKNNFKCPICNNKSNLFISF